MKERAFIELKARKIQCPDCGGSGTMTVSSHAPECNGDCERHGCPIPVPFPCETCGTRGEIIVIILPRHSISEVERMMDGEEQEPINEDLPF